MKITIFGLAGTGTSSVGKALAEKLGYKFKSSGNIFREQAKEKGLSIYEYDELVRSDVKYDIELDNLVGKFGEDNNNFIFESRLAWFFIPDSIKIKLICDEEVTFERISDRENISIEEAKEKTIKRAKTLEERYAKVYPHIKYPPKDEVFDLIIDNTNMSVEEEVEKVINFIKNLSK